MLHVNQCLATAFFVSNHVSLAYYVLYFIYILLLSTGLPAWQMPIFRLFVGHFWAFHPNRATMLHRLNAVWRGRVCQI